MKSGRLVHVGAVDAPVTISDVKAISREVWKAAGAAGGKAAVDVLGWEFALELNETARNVAAESRVDVAFKKIPREVLEKKDFKEDTFHNQWQSYRTRKDPKIELQSKYTYTEPGKYTIVVKVIDILGNDTTKTLEVAVK